MGQVFQRTYKAADGTLRTCQTWTIKYFRAGRPHQEPTKFTKKTQAENLLKRREGKIADGVPISADAIRTTFDLAARDVVNDFKANGKRSLKVVERRLRLHLTPVFGGRRLADISTSDVLAFIADRQEAGASNAEINRETQVLKRCYSLAIRANKVYGRPDIPTLKEAPPRAGFFDRAQVDAVCSHLPDALAAVVTFAFHTGWRLQSEILPLEWRQVDFTAGQIRLNAGTTKNGDGRVFPMTRELRALLEARQVEAERLKKAGHLAPWVFVRLVAKGRGGQKSPKRIRAFTKAWKAACLAAGCPGRIPHDLRRSAIRVFVRASIPERVAMTLAGHKTRSVFERYNIVSETDLTDAAAKLDRDSIVTVDGPAAGSGGSNRQIS